MQIWSDFSATFGLSPEIGNKMLTSLAILLVLYVIRRTLLRFAQKTYREQPKIIYRWFKSTQYGFFVSIFLLLSLIWIPSVGNIGAFLGIVSAGLAIALKDPIVNLAGWIFILLRRPFNVRDRIQIGQLAGDVVDVGIFQITMLEIGNWVAADQSTGRVLHIPNGKVFTEAIANYTQGLAVIWNEISSTVTFESDWKKAKEILLTIAEKYNEADVQPPQQSLRDYMITYTHFSPHIYTTIGENGVILTMRYLCKPRERRTSENQVTEEILDAFNEAKEIDFAYETRRNITESNS